MTQLALVWPDQTFDDTRLSVMLSLLLILVLTPRYFPRFPKDLPTQNQAQGLSVARLLLLLKKTVNSVVKEQSILSPLFVERNA